jgi:hypothetical protein
MRHVRKPLGFLLLLTAQLPGCGSGVLGSSWVQVREQTACEAMNPQYCVGRYGFTVHNDGTFLVGPADNGVSMAGGLSAAELAQISSDGCPLQLQSRGCSGVRFRPNHPGNWSQRRNDPKRPDHGEGRRQPLFSGWSGPRGQTP